MRGPDWTQFMRLPSALIQKRVENATGFGEKYFGIHMSPGLAEYHENGKTLRRLVNEDTIRRMNPSMEGKPLYVLHQDHDMERLHEQVDGWVVRSFYNPNDGKTWAEFIVTSDEGKRAVRESYKLSNSYFIKDSKGGGQWHNLDYDEEVADGVFDHLAMVPNPRYEESTILTPEEFRLYNEKKRSELPLLVNSKKENAMKFNLFKKEKIENASELADALVELSDGSTESLTTIIKEVENAKAAAKLAAEKKAKNAKPAKNDDGDGTVDVKPLGLDAEIMVGDEKMTVKELVQKFLDLRGDQRGDRADASEESDNAAPDEDEKRKLKEKDADNSDESDEEKKKREKAENAKLKRERIEAFTRAENSAPAVAPTIDTSVDQLRRGRERYGSKQA